MPAGLGVSLHCPAVAIKLASSQQPQMAPLVAELRGLQLAMPAAGNAALTVQQLQVLLCDTAASTTPSSSGSRVPAPAGPAAAAASGSGFVPVLQVPQMDDMREKHTTSEGSSSSSTSSQPQTTAGVFGSPQTPRPSSLGRIYQDSLISMYISKLEVG